MNTQNLDHGKPYYGWYIVATLAITETISWGVIYYTFSVFITPMEAELGWSRTQLTAGFSLWLLMKAAMAFPIGHWIDRHGARWLMTIGSIFASLLIIAWSQVTNLTIFYLIWAGLGACAAAVHYEPAFTVIATWFARYRGKAMAIVTFAAGLASTIFIPLANFLLETFGWRVAVFILGIVLAITTIPLHALILRRRPGDLGVLPDGKATLVDVNEVTAKDSSLSEAMQNRFFWLLTFAFSFATLSSAAIGIHFIPFLIDSGFDASVAALAGGSIGLMKVAGRFVFAPAEARLSNRMIVGSVFALQAVAMLILLGEPSLWIIGIYVVLFGFSDGIKTLAKASITAEVFGSSHYGRISSIMAICVTLAGTIAPVTAGKIYDSFGSYDVVLWVSFLLAISATGIMAFSRPDRRIVIKANFELEN